MDMEIGGGILGVCIGQIQLHILYSSPDIIRQGERGGQGMWHAWERREKCTRFWWESPKERDHSKDQGIGGNMGSEWILGENGLGGVWIGFD
jgi:hypothetical protein